MAKKAPARRSKRVPAARAKKAAPKKAAKKAPSATLPKTFAAGSVTFALDVRPDGLEPLLGAAYMMTDRCFVALGGDRRKRIEVTLEGRKPLEGAALRELADLFEREVATQRVRWAVARKNLPVREYIAEQAVRLAQAGTAPAAAEPKQEEELSAEQRKEIDSLIAEVEAEIQSLKGSAADPENLSAPWEAKRRPG